MGNPASFDLNPVATAITTNALPIVVALYEPRRRRPSRYTILPNVYCLRIDYREGPEPPVARFQYLMDDALAAALDWPSQFEQLWPIDAQGDYVVLNDDRLVVLTQDPGRPRRSESFCSTASPRFPRLTYPPSIRPSRSPRSGRRSGSGIRRSPARTAARRARASSDTSGDSDVRSICRAGSIRPTRRSGRTAATSATASRRLITPRTGDDSYPVFLDPLLIETERRTTHRSGTSATR